MTQKSLKSATGGRGFLRLSLFQRLIYITVLVVIGVGLCGGLRNFQLWGQESGVTLLKIPELWIIPFFVPPDDVLKEYIRTPVHLLLQDKAVTVDDKNYRKEVFDSDKPVMVIFYGDSKRSKGLGALVRVLYDEFPQIKVCAYDCKYTNKMDSRDFQKLKALYPVIEVPALLFYNDDNGKIEFIGRKSEKSSLNIESGPESLVILKQWIDEYSAKIKKYIIAVKS